MSEAEILNGLFQSIQTILTIFSMFFTIVSGYLAALFFFLGTAPLPMRVLAFALLTVALVFLGGGAATVGFIQDGLFASWPKAGVATIAVSSLRNPVPLPIKLPMSQQEIGVGIGWIVATLTYVALAYMTFVYRWKRPART